LGEDGGAGLCEDLPLRHVGRLLGHVDVADAAQRSRDVRTAGLEVRDGLLEPVNAGAKDFSLGIERVHRGVEKRDGALRRSLA